MTYTSLQQLLATQADHTPKAIAIAAPDRIPLTYGQLWQQLQQLKLQLNAFGLGRNDPIAIVLPNGPEMAVAFLAVTALAASAPLNPAYRTAEFEFYLSDLKAKALLTLAGLNSPAVSVAQAQGIPVIELIPLPDQAAGLFQLSDTPQLPAPATPWAEPDDIALILHTSGTTSRPKMVPLTQRNLLASAANIGRTLHLTPQDRCLNIMPLFHIHGLMAALLASLAAGASVVCTPGFSGPHFFGWLAAQQPTWYTAVPTMHQAILERLRSQQDLMRPTSLRFIRSSSASLPPQVMAELESVFHAPVIEAYGMTEAAHQMASNPLPPGRRKPGSVGLPAGPEVAIMDEAGALLPQGERGEIVIRGANVTGGYQNNPAANEKAFTQGWFRTGDEGYFDHEGYLFITGRLKEMINRGGEKITPREVDEVLMAHPAIAQAITFAVPHPTLSEDVAAAVILKEGAVLTEQVIRQFAFAHLADYKVPSQILIVDSIPQGATGKLQRIGLADKLGLQLKPAFTPPQTPTETALARLWTQVLKVEQIGLDDNFFALGGDSLQATQLVSRVRALFRVELALPAIFQEPSLTGQAALIEQIKKEQQDRPAAPKPVAQKPSDALSQAPTIAELDCPLPPPSRLRSASALVALRAQGTRPPLFCVPGNLGNVFTDLKYLVHHLGPDQPVYGLQDSSSNPVRVETLATFYLQEIRLVQPTGPYFLAGICSGGVIAFEMARQLRLQGQSVGLLALIEPTLPSEPGLRPYLRLAESILDKIIRRFSGHWQNFSQLDSTAQQSYTRLKLKVVGNNWAIAAYRPHRYPGRLSLFLTHDMLTQATPDSLLAWQARAAEGTDLFELPGSHDTITGNNNTPIEEAPMQVLAERLRRCLDQALCELVVPAIPNPPEERVSR